MTLIIQKPIGAKLNLRKTWQPMDPDAAAYITAVETADTEPLEEKTKIAIDNFVLGCKEDGIWPAIKASCILAGARTLTGALVPLVGTAPTNFNFVAGDYNRKTGLVGDGSTKYLNSNRNNNADPQNNKHIAVHGVFSVSAGQFQGIMGSSFSSNWSALILDNRTPSGLQAWVNGLSYPTGMVPLIAQSGFFGGARLNSTTINSRIGSTNYSRNVNSVTPSPVSIGIFGSGLIAETNGRIAFYSIGESLDLALLDARVTDLINAFAAAIP
jgi:hypothetical protein